MNLRFLYLIHFLFFTVNLFCQDVIIKKDSTRIETKILEISQTEIKYKFFNYPDGPLYIISKNDIACVIYSNGVHEVFNNISIEPKIATRDSFYYDKPIIWKGSEKSKPYIAPKIGDYIKFNIQAGAVINNSYCNVPKPPVTNSRYKSESEDFSKLNNKTYLDYYLGANLVLGKGNICKHIFGMSYLNSTSHYKYHHYSIEYESTYQQLPV